MNKDKFIKKADKHLIHVYNRFPVIFKKGKGVYLYDTEGKQYLDFGSGIGVMAFGYGDKEYTKALKKQIKKITHTSNLFYSEPLLGAVEKLCKVSGMDRAFFTNSGAEAIEGALKTAKKYAHKKYGKERYHIIAMNHSFHGRTVGAVSVTGTEGYRTPFYPLMDGVDFAEFNDLGSVEKLVNDDTCAIITETVQGEGGVMPAAPEFMQGLRKICDERNILLIIDEIQCGLGRTGSTYAFEQYGIRPDILTTAKALGGGVPVGAFLVTEEVAGNSLEPGDHGSTYGGNPFVLAAVSKSLDIIEDRNLPQHVKEMSPYFESILDMFTEKYPFVEGHRGLGFMQGLIIDKSIPVGEILNKSLDEGLVLLSAEGNLIRFLPPLIMEKDGFDEMEEKLTRVLDTFL
ncbi:MAG: aspartate aminotransferase family protein [bacterium LCO1.1]|uniref:Acetylornithine aminotransferase n=1 Tax=Candidatus Weimeria bifida TaxID=2599074 RepID=A0A6N7J0T8_9FIRM|nr:aspartate aminotransferase family protein [Candidatus Weimeria bifida]